MTPKILIAFALLAVFSVEGLPQRGVYYRNGRAYVDYTPSSYSSYTAPSSADNCRPGEYLAAVAPFQNTYACLDRNSGTSDGIYRDGISRGGRSYDYDYSRSSYIRWDPETRSYYRYRE